jgi:hypothetical protein
VAIVQGHSNPGYSQVGLWGLWDAKVAAALDRACASGCGPGCVAARAEHGWVVRRSNSGLLLLTACNDPNNRRGRNALSLRPEMAIVPKRKQLRLDPILETKRVTGPSDPSPTLQDFTLMRRITLAVAVTGGTATFGLADINTVLPSGSTYDVRLQKVSFYGAATDDLIDVTDAISDKAYFRDAGTAGQRRSQIHLTPSLELRSDWNGQAATTVLYTINAPNASTVVVQATVEIRFR